MSEAQSSERLSRALPLALAVLIVAVAVLNGGEVYLKRVGLFDRDSYSHYLETHRMGAPYARDLLPDEQSAIERPFREQMFRSEGWMLSLKLAKDVFLAALFGLALCCLARDRPGLPGRSALLGYLLVAIVAVAFSISAFRHGILLPVAGLRAFSFLPLAILLAALRPLRRALAEALAIAAGGLLAVESFAVLVEAIRGLPIYGYFWTSPDIPGRLVGTFVLPNTLGVFAVLAFAFALSSRPDRPYVPALLLALFLIVAGSSGSGIVVLAVLAFGALLQRLGRRWIVAIAAVFVFLMALLPLLLGRTQLILSPHGRLVELRSVAAHLEAEELLLGKAFGAGTTAGFHVLSGTGPWADIDTERAADSMPAMLLMGTGLLGLASFYALLVWAAIRDVAFRPFWIAVLLCTLTMKLPEIFPLSLFLASALARVFAGDDREGAERDAGIYAAPTISSS
ncbi:MAG: hypothetical protein ACSLFQ_21425 [Thermoanaerobaculia bacterium]